MIYDMTKLTQQTQPRIWNEPQPVPNSIGADVQLGGVGVDGVDGRGGRGEGSGRKGMRGGERGGGRRRNMRCEM